MRALAISMMPRSGMALSLSMRPLSWLSLALRVRRERRALADLETARLDDLGLSARAAWAEGNRPFWELPDNRRW